MAAAPLIGILWLRSDKTRQDRRLTEFFGRCDWYFWLCDWFVVWLASLLEKCCVTEWLVWLGWLAGWLLLLLLARWTLSTARPFIYGFVCLGFFFLRPLPRRTFGWSVADRWRDGMLHAQRWARWQPRLPNIAFAAFQALLITWTSDHVLGRIAVVVLAVVAVIVSAILLYSGARRLSVLSIASLGALIWC